MLSRQHTFYQQFLQLIDAALHLRNFAFRSLQSKLFALLNAFSNAKHLCE